MIAQLVFLVATIAIGVWLITSGTVTGPWVWLVWAFIATMIIGTVFTLTGWGRTSR